jgi:hypothetical protein
MLEIKRICRARERGTARTRFGLRVVPRRGQDEAKLHRRWALAHELGAAAVRFGDGAHDREPEPGATAIEAGADEAAEKARPHVAHDLTLAPHREGDVGRAAAHLHLHRRVRRRVDERVVEQVGDGPAEPGRVPADARVPLGAQRYPLGSLEQRRADLLRHAPELHRIERLHAASLDAGQAEQVVQEPLDAQGRLPDAGDEAPRGLRVLDRPSSRTSALARMAATGFLSSWERSAAKVSTNGRPSSCRRMDTMERMSRVTSRAPTEGGSPARCPELTRSAKRLRVSMGRAIERPIQAAASAAAAPRTRLITSTVGAMSCEHLLHDDGRLHHLHRAHLLAVDHDGGADRHHARGRHRRGRSGREEPLARVVEQPEPQIGAPRRLLLQPVRDLRDVGPGAGHVALEHARDGGRLVLRGGGRDAHGARLDPVDHHQAQSEREDPHDDGQREEHLHPDRQPPCARLDEARDHQGDEEDEADRGDRDDDEARHGGASPGGRSVTGSQPRARSR